MGEVRSIGIIGDGQLGRMLVEDGLRYNPELQFTVLGTAGHDSPAAQVGARQLTGALTDAAAIRSLVERSDVTTWEIEHINAEGLAKLEAEGHNIQPSPESVLTIQDKFGQKQHLERHGINIAPFAPLRNSADLARTREVFGDELMVKSRRGGYDGRGNHRLAPHEGWETIEAAFGRQPRGGLYAEQIVPFRRELALIGARDVLGNIAVFPLVETVHRNNICYQAFVREPNLMPPVAEAVGRATIASFKGAGVFAVEMFETERGEILVNEVAPRVHNSGHWTDLGAETSQFEQHIRAISGDRLGSTNTMGAAIMVNILGTKRGTFGNHMRSTQTLPDGRGHIRWYGKSPRPGVERKIGHITAVGETLAEASIRADWLQTHWVK